MPTIPRLTGPQVRTAPERATEASPAAFAPVAGALAVAADAIGDVREAHARERARADEVVVNQAEVELRNAKTGVLYDPKQGAMFQQGLDAQGAPDRARDAYRTAASAIEARLATPEQKAAFRVVAARHEADLNQQVSAHAGSEFQRVNADTYEALTESELSDIGTHATDTGWVDAAVRRLRTSTALYADRAGWSPEQVERQVETLTSAARAKQVDALVNAGRTPAAEAVLAAHGADLTSEDRAKADAAVGEAKERDTIQSAAARILSTAKTATEAYEMTKSIEDLGTRQSVRKLVEAEFAAKEEAQKRDQEQVYTNAANLVDAAPNRPARAVIPPAQWAQLSVPQREALERRATAPANDNRAWFAFYSMKPEDRAKLTPAEFQTQFWSKFDEAHRTRAEGLYQDSTKDRSGGAVGILTDNERVRSTLVSMHLVSKPLQRDWTDADYTFATAFEQQADTRIRALEASLGRKANATEKQDIVTTLGWEMAPINVRGQSLREQSGLPITTRDYTSTQVEVRERGLESQAYVPYEQIPEAVRRQYTRALEANGRAVTRKVIEDAYGAFLMKNLGRRDTLLGIPLPPGTF